MPKLNLRKIPSTNFLHHLRYEAYKWFPNLFPLPSLVQGIDYWRERDPEINEQTKPPEDEFVDLRCVWAVEFYTPAHLDKLLDGFRKLGRYGKNNLTHWRDPVAWVQRSRRHLSSGGVFNLGPIHPPGTNSPFLSSLTLTAPLPPNIEYATGSIYSLTSSLTCIAMGFVFEEAFSVQFDKALRTERQTYTEPSSKRGFQIYRPEMQKTNHIRQIRSDIARFSMIWFRENLPGLFSSGILGGNLPTCEFVTLRCAEPFKQNSSTLDYMSVLDMDFGFNVWQSKDIPGLKLGMLGRTEHNLQYHSILAAKESNFNKERMGTSGYQTGRESQISYIDRRIKGLLSRWAILPLLEGYSRHLSTIRDSATFRSRSRQDPVGILKTIGHHVSDSVDIAAVTDELISYARQDSLFSLDVDTFEPCNKEYHESGYTLTKNLSYAISNSATWLQKTDQSLRDHLIGYGSLLGAKENIILQKKLTLLTILILVLTAVLVFSTFSSGVLLEFLQSLQNLPVKFWEIITMLVKK